MFSGDAIYSSVLQSIVAEENASRAYIMSLGQYTNEQENGLVAMLSLGQLNKIIGFLYVVGLWSFFKGLYLIKESSNPQVREPVQRAIIHIGYGVAMMNVKEVIDWALDIAGNAIV